MLFSVLMDKAKEFLPIDVLNPHMHKMGPRRPMHCTFGDYFYSNNDRKIRFNVILCFYVRKHMISPFYPKWTKFQISFQLWIMGDPN